MKGFNDKGESIPFQGGTNQEVVIRMYRELRAVGKEKYLLVYWYVGKDQVRPINAVLKSRKWAFPSPSLRLCLINDAQLPRQIPRRRRPGRHSRSASFPSSSLACLTEVRPTGNGNQDTQSWYHSQEINVMIDSAQIVTEWQNALISNQNTQLFGRVGTDGIWRDDKGRTVGFLSLSVSSDRFKRSSRR